MKIVGKWKITEFQPCLTEFIHTEFDSLVKEFTLFYLISQYDDDGRLDEVLKIHTSPFKYTNEPKCGIGQVLFGVGESGKLTRLKSIIDAS